jgi:fatty acid desaturase
MSDQDKDLLLEAHRARWETFWVWLGFAAALILAEAAVVWAVTAGYYLLAVPAILLVAHLMHSQLLAFHEAAHGVLCPNRWVNEVVGLLIGKFHFIGLSLFRAVHHTHHAYLGTEKDEQLWPFVQPRTRRWVRWLMAAFELCLGMVYDVVQFWRAFLRKGSLIQSPEVRRRIWAECGLTLTFWSLVVAATAWFDGWKWLLLLYVIPAVVAGDMHSLRKYIEHMGLTGSTVLGLTRTVVPAGPLGRFLSFTMFNITYHGVHHYYARMPQASLPQFASVLVPEKADDKPIYSNYWTAFCDMVPTLADPRIGAQWHPVPEEKSAPAKTRADAANGDTALKPVPASNVPTPAEAPPFITAG